MAVAANEREDGKDGGIGKGDDGGGDDEKQIKP